jgi:peptidoglycan hydrolase-like protein with peptidoglycan-binding domain
VSPRSLAFVLLLAPLAAGAAGAFTSLHPEEAYPDPTGTASPDPYSGFITKVQEKLRELGFDAGPPNGDFGAKTQTALGQFQLANGLPVSGQLDDRTLGVLGVSRDVQSAEASTGSSTEPAPQTEPTERPGG